MFGCLLCFPSGALRARRVSSAASRLPGITSPRFALHGWQRLYEIAKREHLSLVAAMVDLDFFKQVNDSYGHHIGDVALQRVAASLEESIRASDLLGRYGGEEFCILATNVSVNQIEHFFERIRQKIADIRIPHEGKELQFTVSIGVYTSLGEGLEEMIGKADEALYRAKNEGRNRVVID
ncbi:MAG: GGDEF domain-containing protein [Candidatus Sedimenticola sp. (ex Thyasira tokunagai)]